MPRELFKTRCRRRRSTVDKDEEEFGRWLEKNNESFREIERAASKLAKSMIEEHRYVIYESIGPWKLTLRIKKKFRKK